MSTEMDSVVKMATNLVELSIEAAGLRAEVKCLRQERDAWKEMAMRAAHNPTGAAADGKSGGELRGDTNS